MANMLYNGVELPDINEVWTDKATYPYACVSYLAGGGAELGVPDADLATVQLFEVRGSVVGGSLLVEGPFRYRNYLWTNSQEIIDIYASYGITGQVNSWFLLEDYPALNTTSLAIPTWSSYDILNDDGSVYLAASDPVPVGTSTYDRTAFLSGMAMGLCSKGYPAGANGHMSYNGIELADINSIWTDKSNHVFICKAVNSYFAIVSTVAPYQDSVNGGVSLKAPFYFKQYGCFTDEAAANEYGTTAYTWTFYQEHSLDEGVSNFDQTVIWTSTDIRKDSDGSIFLAASEPFPAGGIGGDDDFAKGYLVGAELRRKRVLNAKEPVAYLYNGIRLPKLPEWDKETYPYAYIWDLGSPTYPEPNPTIYKLTILNSPIRYGAVNGQLSAYLEVGTKTAMYNCKKIDGEFKAWEYYGENVMSQTTDIYPRWTNHDVISDIDATVYYAATEPEPIYE